MLEDINSLLSKNRGIRKINIYCTKDSIDNYNKELEEKFTTNSKGYTQIAKSDKPIDGLFSKFKHIDGVEINIIETKE